MALSSLQRTAAAGRPAASGFTLLEIMIVVVIVGLLAGFSAMALNQASDRPLRAESERFASWLKMVADSALLQGVAYGLAKQGDDWQLQVYYRNQWWPAAEPAMFEWQLPVQLTFRAEAAGAAAASFAVSPGATQQAAPQVALLPNGSLEPAGQFELVFVKRDSRWRVGVASADQSIPLSARFAASPLVRSP